MSTGIVSHRTSHAIATRPRELKIRRECHVETVDTDDKRTGVVADRPIERRGTIIPPSARTYRWSGEFVSFDSTASTLTVKSRIAYQEAVSELKQFKPGEQVWIVWSGVSDSSDAVRQVRRASTGNKIDENMVLPAELVSTEAPNQYLTIRVKVPEASATAIKDVKPGQWVTVTSRHRPATEADAVVAVKPWGSPATN